MPNDLRALGSTVQLRPARRGRRLLVALAAGVLVLGAVGARLSDHDDPPLQEIVTPAAPAVAAPEPAAPAAEDEPVEPATVPVPVLGRVGDLLVHLPATEAVLVSYHEASFPEALAVTPFGRLTVNDNPTRSLTSEDHPEGLPFHVQVSRGRTNASTSAVDVVLLPDEEVRAPVSGTVTEVRPYQLYGTHDDVRIELQPDDSELAVVLIHVEDVVVRAGDRVAVGDVIAGNARMFPFGAVVDRQTEPDRYGHVHMEVKTPE